MTSGVVESVTPARPGDALTADAPVNATVLLVDDASVFSERFDEPQFLVLGDETTPRQYVAVQNDEESSEPQSVTLAVPLTVAAETGLPVTMWDPSIEPDDKRAINHIAHVALDDQDGKPIPAAIPHEKVPYAGAYSLEGARVAIDQDEDDEWFVAEVLGRPPVVDSGYFALPYASAVLPANAPWPTSVPQVITGWEISDIASIVYELGTGIFWITQGGMYRATFGATFEANANGNRRIYPRRHFTDGTTDLARDVVVGASVGQPTALEVSFPDQRMYPGEGLSFEAAQTSGGSLLLFGAGGGSRSRPTEVSIIRVAP